MKKKAALTLPPGALTEEAFNLLVQERILAYVRASRGTWETELKHASEKAVEDFIHDHQEARCDEINKLAEERIKQDREENPPPKSYSPALLWLVLIASVGATLVGFYLAGYRSEQQDNTIHATKVSIQRLQEWQEQIKAGTGTVTGEGAGPTTLPCNQPGVVDGQASTNCDDLQPVRLTAHGTIIGGSHLLQLGFLHKCWFRVTLDGKPNFQGTVDAALEPIYFFENKAIVRDGCPGDVSFNLDGKSVSPKNLAKYPKDVEEVTLP